MSRPASRAELASAERYERTVALITIVTPFIAFILAVVLLWGHGLSPLDFAMCLGFAAITTLGVTMGYHRLFTHKSFKCVTPIRAALCIAGSMAAQGPVLFWVACHRRHHQCSDDEGDPHSPHFAGGGFRGKVLGWWHSHLAWMFNHTPENYFRLAPDLLRDNLVMRITKLYFVWVVGGIVLPGLIGLAVTHTLMGFLSGMLWGGLVRIFLVHHTTWSINSVCHMFGAAPFESEDESRNNIACALLTFGEGWHNNHHAFPTSARHGLMWWQFDLTYIIIRVLTIFRLASDVRLPSAEQLEARRRKGAVQPVEEEEEAIVPPVGLVKEG